jgi:hypothetical protein
MTDEEREIRNSERRTLAEVRRWKRAAQKRQEGKTWEEIKTAMNNSTREFYAMLGIPFEFAAYSSEDIAKR